MYANPEATLPGMGAANGHSQQIPDARHIRMPTIATEMACR